MPQADLSLDQALRQLDEGFSVIANRVICRPAGDTIAVFPPGGRPSGGGLEAPR